MSIVPDYKIEYKTESKFMKLIGKILFFNKDFMTNYTTTLGHTIYFPNEQFMKLHPVTSKITIGHELVHIKDYEKYRFLFVLMYGAPQILAPLAILLAIIAPWWSAVLWAVVCLSPIPAYFRMKLEKKAYTFSIYGLYLLSQNFGYTIDFDQQIKNYVDNFKSSDYYYMWPTFDEAYFQNALTKMRAGEKPYFEPEYYKMVETIINSDFKG